MTPAALPVTLHRSEVLHFLGYPDGFQPSAATADRIDAAIARARALVRARGAWRSLPVSAAAEVGLEPLPATGLVIGLATAGGELEAAASAALAAGDPTTALLLDACGSAAAEEAADRASALAVGVEAGARAEVAVPVSCRVSPGYGAWRLEAQRELFARLPHAALGVRLEASLMMTPRKSVSFALWLGADARPLAGLSGCARCGLETCRYRRAPLAEA